MARQATKSAAAPSAPVVGPWELPAGWRWERLDQIADVIAGQSPRSADCNRDGVGLPFFQGKAEFGKTHPTARNWCEAPSKRAETGDILISVRAPVGPTNVADQVCGIGRGLSAIRPHAIERSLLRLWLERTEQWLIDRATGTTFQAITGDVLRSHLVPIPPSDIQVELVKRLDALSTELNDADEALARAQEDLGIWRKALLKAAVTGELTADWRAAHPPTETGLNLLARISSSRRTARQNDEGAQVVLRGCTAIPEGWARTSASTIVEWASGKFLPDKSMNQGEIPVYGGNGIAGFHNEALVELPTLIIGRVGHYCGNAYVSTGAAWITDNAIYAKSIPAGLDPRFLRLVFEHAALRKVAQGGAQPFVSQALLNTTAIPLPDSIEQIVILNSVEAMMIEHRQLSEAVTQFASDAATLRQSILSAAFRGELIQ